MTFSGTTLLAYQRIGASTIDITQPAISGVQDAATSYGFLRQMDTTDVISVTLASGLTGTMVVAGRNGIWVETITNTSGAKTFGGSTYAVPGSSIAGIFLVVGDLVGIFYIDQVLTGDALAAVITHYQAAGAGGVLSEGANLVTNGDFPSATTGWTAITSTLSVDSGRLRVTATSTSNARAEQQVTGIDSSAYYVLRGTLIRRTATNASLSAFNGSSGSGSLVKGVAALQSTVVDTPATSACIVDPTGAQVYVYPYANVGAAGQYSDYDDLELRQLIPA